MKRGQYRFAAAGAIALCFSQVCAANDWKIRVGPTIENYKHTEFTALGNVKEDGPIYGISLKVARKLGQFEIEGALSHAGGELDYDGFAAVPGTSPVQTFKDQKNSDSRITQASIRVARWFLATGNRVGLYGGVGYRRWDRDVERTAASDGPSNDYEWPYAMLGAMFSLHKGERASFMIDLRAIKPIDPRVRYVVPGRTIPETFKVGSELGYRVEAPFSYKITQAGGIEVVPFYERIKLEESDVKTIFTRTGEPPFPINEPDSETETFGLNINWFQEF